MVVVVEVEDIDLAVRFEMARDKLTEEILARKKLSAKEISPEPRTGGSKSDFCRVIGEVGTIGRAGLCPAEVWFLKGAKCIWKR